MREGDQCAHSLTSLAPPAIQAESASENAFFDVALEAAGRCGVTRLADVTDLDRIGLPVWQAVRPAGRALSVHQGKGASALAARIGALCEAIESHCAETAVADGPCCGLEALAFDRRVRLDDFGYRRQHCPGGADPVQWCAAASGLTGEPVYLPHAVVSLDYTSGLPSPFDRTSAGLGAGSDHAGALQTSLLELIERDAVGEWLRRPVAESMHSAVNLDTLPFDWFQHWREHLRSLAIDLNVHSIESFTDIPVLYCEVRGTEAFSTRYRSFYGTSANPDPEIALFKAFAEAVQSRLTLIAGVRDDILPSDYPATSGARPAPREPTREWDAIVPSARSPAGIAERLAEAGYDWIAAKVLSDGLAGIVVTKAFVPGLGSLTRTRRAFR